MAATLEATPKKTGRPKHDEKEIAERHRAAMRKRRAEIQRASSDIGPIPPIVDPERREAAERSFLQFLLTYKSAKYDKPFAKAHYRCIELIEEAVFNSGLFALAMPRGSGKTAFARDAVEWALLSGHKRYAMLIGAEETHAGDSKDAILSSLQHNDLLMEDFPEVCVPFAALDGSPAKCKGQRSNGERTLIDIDNVNKRLCFPWIEGSKSKGAILRWTGITGRIRGENRALPDGTEIRPDLVVIDDPQTAESAGSEVQNRKRLKVLRQDVLGLAGPGQKVAGIMPCTVIEPNDMIDELLDMERCPEWNGERIGFFLKEPPEDALALWDQYMRLIESRLREVKISGGKPADAYRTGLEFVRENYDALHKGFEVYWPERFDPHELSAVHHAFNTIQRIKWPAWHAEYQNAPVDPTAIERQIRIEDFEDKPAGYGRGSVPLYCNLVTTFIDVQSECLFWMTCAWSEDFRGAIVDYGVWPEQGTYSVDLSNLRYPLSKALGIEAEDARILAALKGFVPGKADETFAREDGAELSVDRVIVDRGAFTTVVDQALREMRLPNVVGAKGFPVGAGQKTLMEGTRAPGDRRGENWLHTRSAKDEFTRYLLVDVNYWKSFARDRIFTPAGSVGDLRMPGKSAREHDPLIDHLTCEYGVRTEKKGTVRDEWEKRPGRSRNDWWDCLVGNYVAASFHGCKYVDRQPAKAPKAQPTKAMSFSELQRMRTGK